MSRNLKFDFLETFTVWIVKSMKLDTCCLRTEAADCVAQYKEQHCCCPSEVWCAASAAKSHREPETREGALNRSDTFLAHITGLYTVCLTTVSLSQTKQLWMVGWLATRDLVLMSEETAITGFEVVIRNSPAGTEGQSLKTILCLSGLCDLFLSLSYCSHLSPDSHVFSDGARKRILPEVLNPRAREGPVLSCPTLSPLPVFRSCKWLHCLKLPYVTDNIFFLVSSPRK